MADFEYFYGQEADLFSFIRVPKLLFTDERFRDLTSDAKILYGLLLDRMSLSIDNDWFDERDIKDKRQVIIATHNATIVTNAMADQVCVMLSDGKNGWIDKAGYPSEDSIKKEIINYLEGGKDSFRHKMKVYEPVLS